MKNKIIEIIKKITGHKYVKLVSKGNAAIMASLIIAKKSGYDNILIPDQSAWMNYLDYPKLFGLETKKIKTNEGLIEDFSRLKDNVLLYQNPAGYFAHQDSKKIYKNKGKGLIIMDVGGSFGLDFIDGNDCDLMLGSFGRWKIINLGYGGFISSNDKDLLNKGKEIYRSAPIGEKYYEELLERLENIDTRKNFLLNKRKQVLKIFSDYNIVHKNRKGLNIIVKFNSEKQRKEIIGLCEKNNLPWKECPCYIRLEEKAISIEIKRL